MSGPFDDDEPGDLEHDNSTNGGVDLTHLDKDAKELVMQAVTRVENLEVQKKEIGDDIKDVYAEAKGKGLDTKIIREVVRRRKMTNSERDEHDTLLELYEGVFR